jgi:predicted nucleic acid-binding Zn ribbon protein
MKKAGSSMFGRSEAQGDDASGNAARAAEEEAAPEQRRYEAPRRRRAGVRTDLTLVKGILAKALAYKGLDKKVERYEFILHWREIVGDKIADVTKPEYISRRALLVTVKHSAWAQELTFQKPVLLQKLARYLKKGDIVNDMIFRVGAL